jgi:hypothetical protein
VTVRVLRPLAVIVLAFVAGALLNPFSSDATVRVDEGLTDPVGSTATTHATVVVTADDEHARTERGAVAAAAAFICNGQQLLDMTDAEVDAYLREVVTTSSADRQVAQHVQDLGALRDALSSGSGPTIYRQGVLAWRVESFDEDEARVAIWHVGVLTRLDAAPPQASWMISMVDLRWERGGWKVAGEIAVPGPAPILNDSVPPANADELIAELDGFTDFGGAS